MLFIGHGPFSCCVFMWMEKSGAPDSNMGSLSTLFFTGSDSPVRELSSIFRSLPWIRTPSVGRRSPGKTTNRYTVTTAHPHQVLITTVYLSHEDWRITKIKWLYWNNFRTRLFCLQKKTLELCSSLRVRVIVTLNWERNWTNWRFSIVVFLGHLNFIMLHSLF